MTDQNVSDHELIEEVYQEEKGVWAILIYFEINDEKGEPLVNGILEVFSESDELTTDFWKLVVDNVTKRAIEAGTVKEGQNVFYKLQVLPSMVDPHSTRFVPGATENYDSL